MKQFATEAIQPAAFEKEFCWFGAMKDQSELERAPVKARIEQWETRSPTGVIRVRSYDEKSYELCVKRFTKDENGEELRVEKEMDIDIEFFKLMKGIMTVGTIKTRYEFPIEGTNLKWEVDVYDDSEGKPIHWCKIDLEVPKDWDDNIPEFPITLGMYFDQDNCTEEEKEFKGELFEKKYNQYNPQNIQTPFTDDPLDKPTMEVSEIAAKHGVPIEQITAQLEKGIKVELEHTSDSVSAAEIARDHLMEYPDYYDRLEQVER